jgi:hypothetical protein
MVGYYVGDENLWIVWFYHFCIDVIQDHLVHKIDYLTRIFLSISNCLKYSTNVISLNHCGQYNGIQTSLSSLQFWFAMKEILNQYIWLLYFFEQLGFANM